MPVCMVMRSVVLASCLRHGIVAHSYVSGVKNTLSVLVKVLLLSHVFVSVQDGMPHEQDEDSERKLSLLHIELETMRAIEQTQVLQQVRCSHFGPTLKRMMFVKPCQDILDYKIPLVRAVNRLSTAGYVIYVQDQKGRPQ